MASGGLMLRPWLSGDAAGLVKAYGDPDIRRWHSRSLSLGQAESWVRFEGQRWQQDRGASWAVTHDGSLWGRVGIGGLDLAEGRASNDQNLWMALGEVTRRGAPSRG